MIELFDRDKKEINRKSSKGNQLKWERNGVWYKADYLGYEGLSEYVISHLLDGIYMTKLLVIDALFFNEDRHTHNIGVIVNADGKYSLCTIFDQGAGLLSDTTMDYPLTGDAFEMMGKAKAKTFCQDFDEQLEIAERMYGENIRFSFTKTDVDQILDHVIGYEKAVVDRVRDILFEQMRKYKYLFE